MTNPNNPNNFNQVFEDAVKGLIEYYPILSLESVQNHVNLSISSTMVDEAEWLNTGDDPKQNEIEIKQYYEMIKSNIDMFMNDDVFIGHVAKDMYVLYSANESAINSGDGFWSINSGWVNETASDLSVFKNKDQSIISSVKSTGDDVKYVPLHEMIEQFGVDVRNIGASAKLPKP